MRRHRGTVLALFVAAVAVTAATTTAPAADRPHGDVKLFAPVPSPGSPEPVVVAPDGTVYTATLNAQSGDTAAPSKVFAFTPEGKLERAYDIKGQDLSTQHGLSGLAMDADGNLYVGSLAPPMVFKLDPKTGKQSVYALYRDVPVCSGTVTTDCSKSQQDWKPWPDYIVLAPDGTLYETDSLQALIWKVPPGGGRGQVWLTDDRLQSLIGPPAFGPSAMKLAPDGKTLMFTTIEGPTGDGDPSAGRIWKLPIQPDGKPGELSEFYTAQSADAPGGIGFAKSGKLYVALSGSNQIAEVGPDGKETGRFPDPVTNSSYQPPLDSPLDVAFRGNSLLVANSGYVSNSSSSFAILDVFVGEPGFDPLRPKVPGASSAEAKRLTLRVWPRHVPAGARVRLRFRVTADGKAVGGARVRAGRTHARSGRDGRGMLTLRVRHAGSHRVTARKQGYRPGHATFVAARRRG
ncbi:MAG: SMP-30/gluconolactonase/LRE family protein [Thermoleophilaceae bacterium]